MDNEKEIHLYQSFLLKDDKPLLVEEGFISDVAVPFGSEYRECRIWESYLSSSYILLQEIVRESPRADALIYPALFNLRHGMEVALKWHIRYAGGVVPRRAGHDLQILTNAFKETAADLDDEANYIVDRVLDWISELASLDPRSVTFRYWEEASGLPIETKEHKCDAYHLCFVVSEIILYFDCLSNKIEICRDENYQKYL